MDGLLIDGCRGDSAGFEDTVDDLRGDGTRGEGTAGVTGLDEGGEVHGVLVLGGNHTFQYSQKCFGDSSKCYTFVMYWGCPLRKGENVHRAFSFAGECSTFLRTDAYSLRYWSSFLSNGILIQLVPIQLKWSISQPNCPSTSASN